MTWHDPALPSNDAAAAAFLLPTTVDEFDEMPFNDSAVAGSELLRYAEVCQAFFYDKCLPPDVDGEAGTRPVKGGLDFVRSRLLTSETAKGGGTAAAVAVAARAKVASPALGVVGVSRSLSTKHKSRTLAAPSALKKEGDASRAAELCAGVYRFEYRPAGEEGGMSKHPHVAALVEALAGVGGVDIVELKRKVGTLDAEVVAAIRKAATQYSL